MEASSSSNPDQPDEAELPSIEISASVSSTELARIRSVESPPFIITVTAILHASRPITLWTHDNIFNGALHDDYLQFINVRTSLPAPNNYRIIACFGGQFSKLTWKHQGVFVTLRPGEPHMFEMMVGPREELRGAILRRWPAKKWDWSVGNDLEKGEMYKVALMQGHEVLWWEWGTKEELLSEEGGEGTVKETSYLDKSRRIALKFQDEPVFVVVK